MGSTRIEDSTHGSRGFTLVELLVAISIFALITTLVIIDFRTGRFNDELRIDAEKLATDVRKVQTLALTGFVPAAGGGNTPEGGYGIRLTEDTGTYILFADYAYGVDDITNMRFQSEVADDQDVELTGSPVAFTSNVSVDASTTNCIFPDEDVVDIVFTAPSASVYVCGEDATSSSMYPVSIELVLTHDRTGNIRTVVVNGVTGRVSVE